MWARGFSWILIAQSSAVQYSYPASPKQMCWEIFDQLCYLISSPTAPCFHSDSKTHSACRHSQELKKTASLELCGCQCCNMKGRRISCNQNAGLYWLVANHRLLWSRSFHSCYILWTNLLVRRSCSFKVPQLLTTMTCQTGRIFVALKKER